MSITPSSVRQEIRKKIQERSATERATRVPSRIRTILVPHDFSEHAEAALGFALTFAEALGANIHLLHVVQRLPYAYGSDLFAGDAVGSQVEANAALRLECSQRLETIAKDHPNLSQPLRVCVIEGTRVADAIDAEASRLHADLIVMGTHGRTGLAHLLLGSVAEATLRRSPCPVLTVPSHNHVYVESTQYSASRIPVEGAF